MPLLKNKSKKAFSKNVETEMDADKPQKQALAIAYSTQRKAGAKKMADGGLVGPEALMKEHYDNAKQDKELPESPMTDVMHAEDESDADSIVDRIMKKHAYADGGVITENSEEDNGESELNGDFILPRTFDERNHEIMDESIDEPIDEASYPPTPSDKNPHDEKDDSILGRIRRKMRK